MPSIIDIATKVEYLYEGKWQKGIIHATKTHEEPDGRVTRVAYLIDTGRDNPDVLGQPEQIEVEQALVRVI